MDHFLRVYSAIRDDDVSLAFTVLILLVLGLALLARFKMFTVRLSGFDRSGPALLTTLGVLGTFAGVFIGLLDFNVSKIDESVPALLAGLKIAFATSIVGMGAAILLKIIQGLIPLPDVSGGEATAADIHATLKDINENIEDAAVNQQASLVELRKAITSDNDTSLLTQVQKLRTTIQDGQNELIKEFREFAHTMAENNSNALIEALNGIISDFNKNLKEQFGENFKQLNEAVAKLLDWQEGYRQHVEALESNFSIAVKGIKATENSFQEISTHTAQIPQTMRDLSELLKGLRAATIDLTAHLQAVASLKESAVQAFPVIEGNIKTLTGSLEKTVLSMTERAEASVKNHGEAMIRLEKGFSTLENKSTSAQSAFDEALQTTLKNIQASMSKSMDGHAKIVEASASEMQKRINEAWVKTQDATNKQLNALDEQLQKELTRSLEIMGRNLASISEKFVIDYEPLTQRLRELVDLARRAS